MSGVLQSRRGSVNKITPGPAVGAKAAAAAVGSKRGRAASSVDVPSRSGSVSSRASSVTNGAKKSKLVVSAAALAIEGVEKGVKRQKKDDKGPSRSRAASSASARSSLGSTESSNENAVPGQPSSPASFISASSGSSRAGSLDLAAAAAKSGPGVVPIPQQRDLKPFEGKARKLVVDELLPKNNNNSTNLLIKKQQKLYFFENFVETLGLSAETVNSTTGKMLKSASAGGAGHVVASHSLAKDSVDKALGAVQQASATAEFVAAQRQLQDQKALIETLKQELNDAKAETAAVTAAAEAAKSVAMKAQEAAAMKAAASAVKAQRKRDADAELSEQAERFEAELAQRLQGMVSEADATKMAQEAAASAVTAAVSEITAKLSASHKKELEANLASTIETLKAAQEEELKALSEELAKASEEALDEQQALHEEKLQAALAEADQRMQAALQTALADAKAKADERVAAVTAKLDAALEQVRALERKVEQIERDAAMAATEAHREMQRMRAVAEEAERKAAAAEQEKEEYKQRFVLVDSKRAALLEELLGFKGNVRVFARVRPFLEGEQAKDDEQAAKDAPAPSRLAGSMAKSSGKQGVPSRHLLYAFPNAKADDAKAIELVEAPAPGVDGSMRAGKRHGFELNRVFNPLSTQAEVFKEVEGVVGSALDGNKVTVLSYGQTGSGKTHTILGATEGEGRGLVPRSAEMVFDRLKTLEAFGWTSTVTASILEVYNEELKDLLQATTTASSSSSSSSAQPAASAAVAPSAMKTGKAASRVPVGGAGAGASSESMEIRHEKGETFVSGLTVVPVGGAADVTSLMSVALASRATHATASNPNSSRSHCIFTLRIAMEHKAAGLKRTGIINLADLAGSERVGKSGAEGQRLLEAQNINKSLSILTQVLFAIKTNAAHVPYRSSKLTYLLQESLGGNCKTLLIANLSPSMRSENESLCTLRFAQSIAEVGSTAGTAPSAASSSSSSSNSN